MDVGRLSETLSWMRVDEANLKIQDKLVAVRTALQTLVTNPGEQSYQVSLTNALKELKSAIEKFEKKYDPAEMDRINQIGGSEYFTSKLLRDISNEISENAMTPASALSFVNKMTEERSEYINRVVTTEQGVDSFVEYGSSLKSGEAEVGFEIPRDLFKNEFSDFINELRAIQRIVRVISEVETGSIQKIELGKISSSDPLVFLNSAPAVIVTIGGVISWILNEWKKVEEIRKVRAETAKISGFEKRELEDFFDTKIKNNIDQAVNQKVEEMLSGAKLGQPRKNELDSELSWALKALFARIERGLRVEIESRLLPQAEEEELDEKKKREQETLEKVKQISADLSFPSSRGSAVLSLPQVPDSEFDRKKPPRRTTRKSDQDGKTE